MTFGIVNNAGAMRFWPSAAGGSMNSAGKQPLGDDESFKHRRPARQRFLNFSRLVG
jgi:hypothetical protein